MIEYSLTSADGTQLAGRHWPVESPKAVMALIHGFGEHCGRYGPMAAHLNALNIAVVAMDLRGHGKSAGKRGIIKTYDDYRADLDALLTKTQALYPVTPMVLYGHSMGGGVVMDHGSRNLDDLPIIASAPLITLADPIPGPLRALSKFMGLILPNGSLPQPIDGSKVSNLPERQNLYATDPLGHRRLGFRLTEEMVANGERLTKGAKNWDRPLLMVHSKIDQLTGYQGSADFARDAKQVEFHAFETCQHEIHNDEPRDEVHTLMSDFILKHCS